MSEPTPPNDPTPPADPPKPPEPPASPPPEPPKDEPLGEGGIKALQAEREARREAEKARQAAEAEARKAREERDRAKADAQAEVDRQREEDRLRAEAVRGAGLPADFADRITGSNADELKADAEKLAASLATNGVRRETSIPAPKPVSQDDMFTEWDRQRR